MRLRGEVERLESEVALLREELRIEDARAARIDPRRRPHFPPVERLAVLALKTARGWSMAQTARHFGLAPSTIAAWLRRLDEKGEDALVRTATPVNRFPDFVREVVTRLKLSFPHLGRRRIADLLARAGLHLAASTVKRLVDKSGSDGSPPPRTSQSKGEAAQPHEDEDDKPKRVVTAKRPGHVFHVDLTALADSSSHGCLRLCCPPGLGVGGSP